MSEMLVTTASPYAVDHVFANMWARGREELQILGLSSERARDILESERAAGNPSMAIWFDGEPVVILGLMRATDPAGRVTWFEATDLFARFARPITQCLRDSMARFAKENDVDFIEIFSPCVHPASGRWFRALGFGLDVNHHATVSADNPRRIYRFVRTFSREG